MEQGITAGDSETLQTTEQEVSERYSLCTITLLACKKKGLEAD
jgi:hypothetical protein